MRAYNLETVVAEKFQTVIARDVANTRMRDFYDLHTLLKRYNNRIDFFVLKDAYLATSKKRKTEHLIGREDEVIARIEEDEKLHELWNQYQKRNLYAADILFEDVVKSIRRINSRIK